MFKGRVLKTLNKKHFHSGLKIPLNVRKKCVRGYEIRSLVKKVLSDAFADMRT